MKLEKIVINGFKSFADRTEIVLDGNITGIVGPNGSGKSNVADALRWVLGEQNSKSLRGSKMEDFIFAGTQKRNQKSLAEVSLHFNNEDRRIDSDFTEVVISRKMYRSGESEYLLNGANVRLKDILNTIRDTGIGKEGYSIVGQGKIDEILSAKPEARRKVFEEASGVMKYRVRKEEAENKLRRTEENLVRINDILEELNNQVGPLSEQAEKTRRYQTLFERGRFLDINIFLVNYERVNNRLSKLKIDIEELEKEIWKDKNRFEGSTRELELVNEKLALLEQQIASARARYEEINAEAENANSNRSILSERLSSVNKDIERLEAENSSYRENEVNIRNAVSELEIQKGMETVHFNELQDRINAKVVELNEANQKQLENEKALSSLREKHLSLLNEQKNYQTDLASSVAREEGRQSETTELKRRLENQTSYRATYIEARERLEGELKTSTDAEESMLSRIRDIRISAKEILERKLETDKKVSSTRTEYDRTVSKVSFLNRLKDDYEGFSQSVRGLMKELKRNSGNSGDILGTLAELIEVPKEYEKAIEAVLGGTVQNVVVRTEEDAKYAISILREKKLGRVSFMPLNSLKVRYLSQTEKNMLGRNMFIASSVIGADREIMPAIEFLLARTVIVDNFDSAVLLARKASQAFRIVTLEGDVINSGGVITGGSSQQRNYNIISRSREIEETEALVSKLSDDIEKLKTESNSFAEKIREHQDSIGELNSELEKIRVEKARIEQRIANADHAIAGSDRDIESINERLLSYSKDSDAVLEKEEGYKEKLGEIEASIDSVLKEIEGLEALGDDAKAKELASDISDLMVEKTRSEGNRDTLGSRIAELSRQIEINRESIEGNEEKISSYRSSIAELEAEISRYAEAYRENRSLAESYRKEVEQGEAERIVNNTKLQEITKAGADFQLRQSELSEAKYKLTSQAERLSMSLETSQNKIWEDYGLTYGEAEKLKEPINFTQSSRELTEIREEIRELGPVNPNAIEEYERVSSRRDEMELQRNDLEKAKTDLEELITQILSSMKVIFTDRFEKINENFGKIFVELFGGGKASISLSEGDVMEAGIEIFAEPPGKKIQNISALSGGERALTGIALLFAMIELNPSPICMLDEIDAPLDEANLYRFGDYIKKLNDSQFLIITHRKPTMSICPVLFGITMEEKGVSKLVSVKVEA